MPKLPRLSAKEIIVILERSGFIFVRQSGSHKMYKDSKERRITVPFHGTKILHPKVLKSIMRDADLKFENLKQK